MKFANVENQPFTDLTSTDMSDHKLKSCNNPLSNTSEESFPSAQPKSDKQLTKLCLSHQDSLLPDSTGGSAVFTGAVDAECVSDSLVSSGVLVADVNNGSEDDLEDKLCSSSATKSKTVVSDSMQDLHSTVGNIASILEGTTFRFPSLEDLKRPVCHALQDSGSDGVDTCRQHTHLNGQVEEDIVTKSEDTSIEREEGELSEEEDQLSYANGEKADSSFTSVPNQRTPDSCNEAEYAIKEKEDELPVAYRSYFNSSDQVTSTKNTVSFRDSSLFGKHSKFRQSCSPPNASSSISPCEDNESLPDNLLRKQISSPAVSCSDGSGQDEFQLKHSCSLEDARNEDGALSPSSLSSGKKKVSMILLSTVDI